jgi:hypothetical protein
MRSSDRPGPHRGESPPRLWTVEEANGRLAALRELLPQLRAWAVRLAKVHDELGRLKEFWGKEVDATDSPDRDLWVRLEDEWTRLGQRLEQEVLRLQTDGIEVKDLETGLVDFYSLRGGEVIFLCWQRGEAEVGHWHTLSGGFRTRRPIEGSGRSSSTPRASRSK